MEKEGRNDWEKIKEKKINQAMRMKTIIKTHEDSEHDDDGDDGDDVSSDDEMLQPW